MIDSGRRAVSAIERRMANSLWRSSRSATAWNTPLPVAPIALAMPSSSSEVAVRLGVMRPSTDLWATVREVLNPRAPASIPSATRRPMRSISSGVGPRRGRRLGRPSRSRAPRRGAPGRRGRWPRGRRSRASRYSGKVSHSQVMPSCSAVPGMSSTPSIRATSHSWRSGRTGAKPTPQLPMTTVVTPCQRDGLSVAGPSWPGRRSGCGCRPSRARRRAPSASSSRAGRCRRPPRPR